VHPAALGNKSMRKSRAAEPPPLSDCGLVQSNLASTLQCYLQAGLATSWHKT